jgi:tRNA pseudouridine65 synthase
MKLLSIVHSDDYCCAVNKPAGMLLHASKIDKYEEFNLRDLLGQQLGKPVYPVHRLDKGTSGIVVFGFDRSEIRHFQESMTTTGEKVYLALVRGYFPPEMDIDYPLANPERPGSPKKEAFTKAIGLLRKEIPVAVSRYPASRFSLVALKPREGRMHQLRRHLEHSRHYLIGDRKYGERHYNRLMEEHFGIRNMFLHAWKLSFRHPISGERLELMADLPEHFEAMLKAFDWTAEFTLLKDAI